MDDLVDLIDIALSTQQDRAQAENILIDRLSTNIDQFTSICTYIKNQHPKSLQMILIINTVIKNVGSITQLQTFGKYLTSIYLSKMLPQKLKITLKSSMKSISSRSSEFFDSLKKEMFQYAAQGIDGILAAINIYGVLLESYHFAQIKNWDSEVVWFAKITYELFNSFDQYDIQNHSELYEDFYITMKEAVNLLFSKDEPCYIRFQDVHLQCKTLGFQIYYVLNYQTEENNTKNIENIISVKKIALDILETLLKRIVKSRTVQQYEYFWPLKYINQLTQQMLNFFINTSNSIQNESQMISLLTTIIQFQQTHDFFFVKYQNIFTMKMNKYLILTKEHTQILEDEPSDFIFNILNFEEYNNTDDILQISYKFIQQIAKNIQGASIFLAECAMTIFIKTYDILLNNQMNNETTIKIYDLDNQQQQLLLVENNTINVKIENNLQFSLITLHCIIPFIQQCDTLFNQLQLFIDKFCIPMLNFQNEQIQILYCKLIGQFLIINQDKKLLQSYALFDYFTYLIQQNKKGLILQTVDNLGQIIQIKSIDKHYKQQYFNQFENILAQLIIQSNDIKIINYIQEWIEQYNIHQNNITSIGQEIIIRIVKEQIRFKKLEVISTIFLSALCNLLITITQKLVYNDCIVKLEISGYSLIEQALYYQNELDYKDSLIYWINQMIDKQKIVTINQCNFVHCIIGYSKEQYYQLDNIFLLLNNIMYYGSEYFLSLEAQQSYFDIAISTFTQSDNETKYRQEGALLIQIGIEMLKEQLHESIIQNILEVSYQELQITNCKLFYSRILSIFLVAFLNIENECQQILGQHFLQIKNELFLQKILAGYDNKLFIIYYSKLIRQDPQFLITSIQIGPLMLIYQLDNEKQENNFNDLDYFQPDDSDSNYEENQYQQTDEEIAFQATIANFKSGYMKMDEYTIFKDTIAMLNFNCPEIVKKFKEMLDPLTFKRIIQVLQTSKSAYDQPRQILVPKKRKQIIQ